MPVMRYRRPFRWIAYPWFGVWGPDFGQLYGFKAWIFILTKSKTSSGFWISEPWIQSQRGRTEKIEGEKHISTPAGFEPAPSKRNRFLICRRNHLAIAPWCCRWLSHHQHPRCIVDFLNSVLHFQYFSPPPPRQTHISTHNLNSLASTLDATSVTTTSTNELVDEETLFYHIPDVDY